MFIYNPCGLKLSNKNKPKFEGVKWKILIKIEYKNYFLKIKAMSGIKDLLNKIRKVLSCLNLHAPYNFSLSQI